MIKLLVVLFLIKLFARKEISLKVTFSFEKGSKGQNHSSLDFHQLNQNFSSQLKFLIMPPTGEGSFPSFPLMVFGKPCQLYV